MTDSLVVAVVGPTASGKTAASIAIAKELNGEIVCCDSMQIYEHMRIGTASPTDEERRQAPHHLFNFVDPRTNFNAALYQEEAREKISDIINKGKVPILCGGTGLYLKAALYNMNFSLAASNTDYRKSLEEIYNRKGVEYIYNILKEKDPESAANIHKNNVKRVIRALEIHYLSGIKKSDQIQTENKEYAHYICGLQHERKTLYERIEKRVDLMISEGLEGEVRKLIEIGVDLNNNAMQAIGYKEWIQYYDGNVSSDECINKIKQNSRNYAKRQITWFNKMDVKWHDYDCSVLHNYTNILDDIKK